MIKDLFTGQRASPRQGELAGTARAAALRASGPPATSRGKPAGEAGGRPKPATRAAEGRSARTARCCATRSTAGPRRGRAKNADGYLAHYAPDFEAPGGEPRAHWEATAARAHRQAQVIEVHGRVTQGDVRRQRPRDRHFRQGYKSDTLEDIRQPRR